MGVIDESSIVEAAMVPTKNCSVAGLGYVEHMRRAMVSV